MKSADAGCDEARLTRLLQLSEDSPEFRQAARHIDSCPTCQLRLEQLAADQQQWQDARQLLSPPGPDSCAAATLLTDWSPARLTRGPTAWTESMAQQLLSPASHPELLGRIGRYDVERLIGSGGMGVVFKAFDTELNRPVAVKVLAPHLAGSGAARKRFAREARAAAAIVHEHVVAIHNVESEDAAPFLVMQFVAGESLQTRIDREGPLNVSEILRIARQVAAGLSAAHAQGLVHRDIKPGNILLEHGIERTLLTDFGLARASDDASLTHSGFHPGTPQYMSPEQARGDSVDARSDLFSLGSVMYAMCTGRSPFRADSSYAILRRIVDTEPRPILEVNADIPDWLERIVARLHAKLPQDRYQSASEVADLLQQCLAHVQQPTTVSLPETCHPPQQVRTSARFRYAAVMAAIVISCVGVAALIPGISSAPDPVTATAAGPHSVPLPAAADQNTEATADPNIPADNAPTVDWDFRGAEIADFSHDLAVLEQNIQRDWTTSVNPAARIPVLSKTGQPAAQDSKLQDASPVTGKHY